MTDRELLELAAKAAGYEIEGEVDRLVAQPGHFAGGFSIFNERGGSSIWNPLTDDGDALRLAVKMGFDLFRFPLRIEVVGLVDGIRPTKEDFGNDPYAATRRAIVRAAAEIGKESK